MPIASCSGGLTSDHPGRAVDADDEPPVLPPITFSRSNNGSDDAAEEGTTERVLPLTAHCLRESRLFSSSTRDRRATCTWRAVSRSTALSTLQLAGKEKIRKTVQGV